jgi:hypothetical protein
LRFRSNACSTLTRRPRRWKRRRRRSCTSLQRELEDRGYRVLPEQELPEDAEAYVSAVQADLQRSALSVHLIGARYGSTPDGVAKSGVVLQAELALAQQMPPLRSIFWSPPEITPAVLQDERQRGFVEHLDQAEFDRNRVEFVRESLEQLKSLVVDRLRSTARATTRASATDASKAIYLLCDAIDRANSKPLQAALTTLGFTCTRPSIDGTVEELIEENKANLVSCDVVIIVWGSTREAWVRSKLRDLQQAPGWGRTRSFDGKFIVIGPPDTPAKLDFDTPADVVVLRGTESTGQLEALLQRGSTP